MIRLLAIFSILLIAVNALAQKKQIDEFIKAKNLDNKHEAAMTEVVACFNLLQ